MVQAGNNVVSVTTARTASGLERIAQLTGWQRQLLHAASALAPKLLSVRSSCTPEVMVRSRARVVCCVTQGCTVSSSKVSAGCAAKSPAVNSNCPAVARHQCNAERDLKKQNFRSGWSAASDEKPDLCSQV